MYFRVYRRLAKGPLGRNTPLVPLPLCLLYATNLPSWGRVSRPCNWFVTDSQPTRLNALERPRLGDCPRSYVKDH